MVIHESSPVAQLLCRGYAQPRLPADLRFDDLLVPEMNQTHVEVARAHGTYGFCYYHFLLTAERKSLLLRAVNSELAGMAAREVEVTSLPNVLRRFNKSRRKLPTGANF